MGVSGCQAHLLPVLCQQMACRVWGKRENGREKIDSKLLEVRGLVFIFVFQAADIINVLNE